jgi:RHS repeat-associated protein
MTVPMGFSGTNNARRYKYIYDSTGRQIGMDIIPSTVTSNATLSSNVGSSSQTRFYYNDSENRIKLINKAGDVYYFVYDPTASIPAVVYEAVNNGEAVATYLNMREPDGSLISRDKYDDTSLIQSRTYHFDGLGSTLSLTDEDGDVTDTYTYNAWGDVTNHTGSTTDNPYRYVGQLGYYSHYQEPTFDLLQLGVRFYDSEIGRFTQRDPVKRGVMDHYIYVNDLPTVKLDPSGLTSIAVPCGAGANFFDCWTRCRRRNWSCEMSKKRQAMISSMCALFCSKFAARGCNWFYRFCTGKGDTPYAWLCMDIYYAECLSQ